MLQEFLPGAPIVPRGRVGSALFLAAMFAALACLFATVGLALYVGVAVLL